MYFTESKEANPSSIDIETKTYLMSTRNRMTLIYHELPELKISALVTIPTN